MAWETKKKELNLENIIKSESCLSDSRNRAGKCAAVAWPENDLTADARKV